MRLRRLHLTRYGGFRDATLDLPRPDGPDVTVVLGPNEAGKSTAFSAWLDVLFGIPTNTKAAWRFERSELEIAAEIETADGPRHLRRLPTKRDSLRDADGSAVPESEIAALLHGLTRDGYRTRFSLDREMLERGGQDIAGGKGDLGDLLFAGMAGLSGVQDALDQTQAAADAFHRLGGRRTKSTVLGAGLIDLKASNAALKTRLTPQVQARLDAAVVQAQTDLDATTEGLAAARRALACESEAVNLRKIDARIAALDTQLAALPRCTWSPALAEAARAAHTAFERATQDAAEARAALARAQADLDACARTEDEGVAEAVLSALTALQVDGVPVIERLGPVNDADLQRITDRRAQTALQIASERRRFGLSGPAAGPPSGSVTGTSLADRLEPNLRLAADAQADLDRADVALTSAKKALAALEKPQQPEDMAALRGLLDGLRALDLTGLRRARDATAEALDRLALDGPLPADLPDPDDLRTQIARHQDVAAQHAAALAGERAARQEVEAKDRVARAAQQADAGTDAQAAERARHARDAAWQDHRHQLDPQSAETFKTAMDAHDRLVAGLAEAAVRAETARAARDALIAAEAKAEDCARTVAQTSEVMTQCDLSALALRLGLPANTSPEALPSRLERLRELARTAPAATRAAQALEAGEAEHARITARLTQILGDPLDDAQDPEAAAQIRLQAAEASATARGQYTSAQTTVSRAQDAQIRATETAQKAQRALQQDLQAAGLASLALSDLQALRALETLERDDAEDARRQSALMRARDAAAPELARLAALGAGSADPIAAARRRAATDQLDAQKRAAAAQVLAAAQDRRDRADQDVAQARVTLSDLLQGQGGSGTGADRITDLSNAARLAADRAALLHETQSALDRHDPEALDAARALAPDPSRHSALEDAVTLAEADQRAAIARLHDAQKEQTSAQLGDTAAAAAQTRAAILADLGEGARRAAAALIGQMAGKAALSRLVQENRGAMVSVASDAFRRITDTEWDGLEVFGPDGMTLQAFAGERRSAVTSLSTGAQGQLFLALRVAGHAAFCDRHTPLPFITDDILEAFDDTRARAAMQTAADMGHRGQVVFFTHHDHIAVLASDVIAGVSIVEMPRQGRRTPA